MQSRERWKQTCRRGCRAILEVNESNCVKLSLLGTRYIVYSARIRGTDECFNVLAHAHAILEQFFCRAHRGKFGSKGSSIRTGSSHVSRGKRDWRDLVWSAADEERCQPRLGRFCSKRGTAVLAHTTPELSCPTIHSNSCQINLTACHPSSLSNCDSNLSIRRFYPQFRMDTLLDLGLTAAQARDSLNACNNDLTAAIEW